MKTFKQFFNENIGIEYHYTIVGIGGYHSENIIVLKSYGHVPDQKVEGLVKYTTQLANEQFGEDEDYQGEYEDYVEFGTAEAMSNFYHDVGIDEAVGEYHINEQYKLVKHIPPHRPITAGDANFEGDEMFFIRSLDGWDGSVNENFKDGKKKGKSRPGRVKKAGTSCNGSVTELRKRAKNSSGEKAKMSHWCANMKSGKKKN